MVTPFLSDKVLSTENDKVINNNNETATENDEVMNNNNESQFNKYFFL